jgi:two-component system sensor histidine kinase YesM
MHEYILIILIAGSLLLLSISVINSIATTSTMEQARQSATVIYKQAMEQMMLVEEDIYNLRLNIMCNSSAIAFIESGSFTARWEKYKGVQEMIGDNRRINKNLENIMLYDGKGELFFALGEVFAQKTPINPKKVLSFSGSLFDKTERKSYYIVGMPVYIKNDNGAYKSSCSIYLLFNTINLQNIVNKALINPESTIALVDSDNKVIVQAGKWSDSYSVLRENQEDRKRLAYVTEIGSTGWRMVNVLPKRALVEGAVKLKNIAYITYLIIILAMAFLCLTIYIRIMRPISRQTAFMASFVKDTKRRIKVVGDNEIGRMAEKMNVMLDDIETLNQQIMESNQSCLKLHYEKKQTELLAFRSQINPHFLSNTFECIRGMALSHGEREIADLIKSLSSILRYNIKGDELASIIDEVRNLQEYAKIIDLRFQGRLKVHVDAQSGAFHCMFPKMLLQPLIENAVFHGLETKIEGGAVHVGIQRRDGLLIVEISDDGNGIAHDQLAALKEAMARYDSSGEISEKFQGIGFLNVYRRLRLFYGDSATLTLESNQAGGTRITLTAPAMSVSEN